MTTEVTLRTDIHEAMAAIRKGQQAWTAIKATAAEQRFWWMDVGNALLAGKKKENRPDGMKFSDWVQATFPGLHQNEAGAAIWFASEFPGPQEKVPKGMSLPSEIKRWFNDQEATHSLPSDLQSVTPVLTPNSTNGTLRRSTNWPTVQPRARKEATLPNGCSGPSPSSTGSSLNAKARKGLALH